MRLEACPFQWKGGARLAAQSIGLCSSEDLTANKKAGSAGANDYHIPLHWALLYIPFR